MILGATQIANARAVNAYGGALGACIESCRPAPRRHVLLIMALVET